MEQPIAEKVLDAPLIELVPMPQRSEVREQDEDWTGKTSTALRRKLQNRLNKRASRKRHRQPDSVPSHTPEEVRNRAETAYRSICTPLATSDPPLQIIQRPTPSPSPTPTPSFLTYHLSSSANGLSLEILRRPPRTGMNADMCVSPQKRRSVTSAPDFTSFICAREQNRGWTTPLPCDQKLLTLMHFNLVRALTQNVYLLGINPDDMNLDLQSPFFETSGPGKEWNGVDFWETALPETLRPTRLQRAVSHHPEIDVFPFPRYRDNLILAGKGIDDVEICLDLLYGVEESDLDLPEIPRENTSVREGVGGLDEDRGGDCRGNGNWKGFGGRTGLIVWSDPWLQSSWEVEESFARKYRGLLKGCRELIDSSNFWRARRGERPFVLEELD